MGKSTKIVKRILALFLVVLISIESFAAVVSDNDGAAFVTKAEFEALKKDFNNQIENYNNSIDSKIDGAIASYLKGMQLKRKMELKNHYVSWNDGTMWRWGNNAGTRTELPYGGAVLELVATDTQSALKSTMNWSGASAWTNNLFIGYDDTKMIELKVYNWRGVIYDVTTHHYYQGSSGQNSSRTWYSYRNSFGNSWPTRDGRMHVGAQDYNTTIHPESHIFAVYLVESFLNKTTLGTLSINRNETEYFIQRSGDTNSTPTVVQANLVPKSLYVGDYPIYHDQQVTSKWTPNWAKNHTHNLLRVKDWEDLTGYQEQICSGAPVAFVDAQDNEIEVEIKLKSTVAGKLYIYASENAIAYNSLVFNNYTKQINLTANNLTTINLTDCPKESWIRVAFLPNSGTGSLTISSITAEI